MHVTLNADTTTLADARLLEGLLGAYAQINILNILLEHAENLPRNAISLWLKMRNPSRVYSFGGVVMEKGRSSPGFFSGQVKSLKAAGFDGVKLFGKPTVRRTRPYRFNDAMYAELYQEIERQEMPLNFHIGDPPSFWSVSDIPAFAKEKGWYYGNEALPSPGELLAELEEILAGFPGMTVIVPHMMFLSHDLERLSMLLNRYPRLYTDITPGVELYYALAKDARTARAFFMEYSDRILFGTDSAVRATDPATLKASLQTGETVKRFLREKDAFVGFGERLSGLGLQEEQRENILFKNFQALCGKSPRALHIEGVRGHCAFLMERALNEGCAGARQEIEQALNEMGALAENMIGSSDSI